MRGVSISSRSLTASSTATLVVDLKDANGKTYDNVSITYGLGGIMDATATVAAGSTVWTSPWAMR